MSKASRTRRESTQSAVPSEGAAVEASGMSVLARRHQRFGWSLLFAALATGLALESLLGFKIAGFVMDPLRHELWSLAHFHAVFLAMLNLVYVRWADAPAISESGRRSASNALMAGSLLLPLGFFLGGIAHYEGDPGIGILAVPAGAVLLLYTVLRQALAAWR